MPGKGGAIIAHHSNLNLSDQYRVPLPLAISLPLR